MKFKKLVKADKKTDLLKMHDEYLNKRYDARLQTLTKVRDLLEQTEDLYDSLSNEHIYDKQIFDDIQKCTTKLYEQVNLFGK